MTPASRRPTPPGDGPRFPILTLVLRQEHDVVLARQRARQLAALLGFDTHAQTRVATAVSELARNAHEHGGGGRVEFAVRGAPGGAQQLAVRVTDQGRGIADLEHVLSGRYVSPTGMGVGLVGARRLTDSFEIASAPGAGTMVEVGVALPAGTFRGPDAARLADDLARADAGSAFHEMQAQNQELLRVIEELRDRQAEVERLNAELQETNRGVLVLYAELDDRAADLKRASEYKSRFLSEISHEFRTPLTSVLNITRLLLDRSDGPLTSEQERQVSIVRNAVNNLADMVNDLLDLARIEAGQTVVRPSRFTTAELLSGLRGIFRPLATDPAVSLVIEEGAELPPLFTDQSRVAQVLRNFVSNALKFTERGEVRVTARAGPGDTIVFTVADTGIGIAPEDQGRVFLDFTQVDSAIQRRVRGTGLGLPLSRRLARLLGGDIALESEVGRGSTFVLTIPREYGEPVPAGRAPDERTPVGAP